MCSEEGEENSKLIELDKQIILWNSNEAWYISTTVDDSRDTKRHHHVQSKWYIVIGSTIITSPHCSISLRPEESGPG